MDVMVKGTRVKEWRLNRVLVAKSNMKEFWAQSYMDMDSINVPCCWAKR